MPRLLSILVLLLPVLFPGAGLAEKEHHTLIVGGDYNYPPYEFLDEDNQPAGYNVDLTKAIAEVMGVNVEFKLENWEQARLDLQNGKIDALQGMIASMERRKHFIFAPHSIVHQAVFARKPAKETVSSLAQLQDKTLVVQQGGIMHDYLLQAQLRAKLILVSSHADALRLLSSGTGDYALVANLPGLYLGRTLKLSNIAPVGKPFTGLRYGFAVNKNNEELLALFSQGLAILKNTGRQQKIYDRWLGPYEPRVAQWKTVIQVGSLMLAPLLLIFFATVFWNRSLKREVARRTAELKLQQQQLIQADKMTSLGTLVSGVAHEINNPTGLLLFNLPLLEKIYRVAEAELEEKYQREGEFTVGGLKYSLLREDARKMFTETQSSAVRIKRIVDDLKDFARKETSDLNEIIDLNEVVKVAVRLVQNSINKSTSCFHLEEQEALPTFHGNRQRIEQVIINLLLNACQSITSCGQGIWVRSYLDGESDEIVLEIQDQGKGIAPEHLSQLTDPFFTTKREQGGTGLGLSISAGIIAEHQGILEFQSELGVGTTVFMRVPRQGKD